MDLKLRDSLRMMRLDKRALKQAVDALNGEIGFVPVAGMTPQRSQEVVLESGVRPEENVASCEIKRMRSERGGT